MMVTKQTLHVAGVVRSPQLQYELSEALAEDIGTEVDLRVGGLKAWAPGLLVAERTPASCCSRSIPTIAKRWRRSGR